MSKPPILSIAADFDRTIHFFKDRGVIASVPSADTIAIAKKIHRATYSLIIWRFRLGILSAHGRPFIEEIASDALQILPQVLMGYGKTANLLTRGIIENTLRHVYFTDHPIEFARMNREGKWYVTIESLLEYAKIHPVFLKSERKFDAIDRIGSLYRELSAHVHGRTVNHLEMRLALNLIEFDAKIAKKQSDAIEKCAAAANFILAMFHHQKLRSLQVEDQRIILRTMPASARQLCRSGP
jgi:hypothetical protein